MLMKLQIRIKIFNAIWVIEAQISLLILPLNRQREKNKGNTGAQFRM